MGINKCFKNREISWLEFNERVLEEAADTSNPLCERLSFTSIFQNNLDEFFMVRVGSIHDQMIISKDIRENKTNMTCSEQLDAIMEHTVGMLKKKDDVYNDIMHSLAKEGIEIINFARLSSEDAAYLKKFFQNEIKPLISPQVVGKRQPFPFLQNKKIYALVSLDTKNSNEKIGIVPCCGVFDRLISIPSDNKRFMLVEELILHFASDIFDKYKVKGKTLVRIIRNADIDAGESAYDEDSDYRHAMEKIIRNRKKLCPVKAELSRAIGHSVIKSLCEHLDLTENQIFSSSAPLDLSFISGIQDILKSKPELFYPVKMPQQPSAVDKSLPMIKQIENKDILLSYPYESMKPFLRLLNEAAEDKNVVSIKMTLYRVAKYSQVVQALINAAENGKEVVVLVELKARFDEENNIEWSRRLEDAGCRIIYGIDGLKVHSKLCLITRKEDNKIEYITQIGTGNYNEKTARIYTDYCLMTSSAEIGMEAGKVFNELAMGEVVENTEHLLVAPKCLQNKILSMIDAEIEAANAGKPAYIGAKINSLTNKSIIKHLIKASQAGVKIDLIIRGICCLIPGIEGYTDNINVISIVGRYLEHSRVYIFGNPAKIYISSADYMTRNTLRRVEVAAPVYDDDLKKRIFDMFSTMLNDNVKARVLNANGKYTRRTDTSGKPLNSQEYFTEQAYSAANNINDNI